MTGDWQSEITQDLRAAVAIAPTAILPDEGEDL